MSTGHCVQTNSLVSWWALLGTSLLQHSTSWRGTAPLFLCWPPPQRRQVPPLCPARAALRLSPHCHLRSLSPVRGSLSLAALLALPPSVKRCSRAGFPSSSSLWCCCTRWATLIWRLPSLPKFSYVILTCPPSHVSQACSNVDCTIREALESILGGPLTDWSSLRGGFQPVECLAACTCYFPVVFLALPDASGENAGTSHLCSLHCNVHRCCPVPLCIIQARLAEF